MKLIRGAEDAWVVADDQGRLGFFRSDRNALRPSSVLSVFHDAERSQELAHALYETWLQRAAAEIIWERHDDLWFDERADRFLVSFCDAEHAAPFIQLGLGRWWDESKRVLEVTGLAPRHAEIIDAHLDALRARGARANVLNVTEDGAMVEWERLVAQYSNARDEPGVYVVQDRGRHHACLDDLPEPLRARVIVLACDFRRDIRIALPQ